MPFAANTPESLLARADSKNPSSTCRGITSSGRPCRRPVAPPPPPPSRLARAPPPDPRAADDRLYCWQHKDQAHARHSPGPGPGVATVLEERSSLDTLADRLGLVDLADKKPAHKTRTRPVPGKHSARPPKAPARPSKPPASRLSCCFCLSVPLDEAPPPPARPARPQPQPVQQRPPRQSTSAVSTPTKKRLGGQAAAAAGSSPASHRSGASSQTARLKDLIPDALDTPTASALMAELARPLVDSEEPGYIYMFWLTPTSSSSRGSVPPVEAARALLAPPPSSSFRSRRPSDVVSKFALDGDGGDTPGNKRKKKTMLLKIGRAANVQRRMNQWQRQCGHDIELLRFYPYIPSTSPSPSPTRSPSKSAPSTLSASSAAAAPRPTPHCHRVERLVHIELAGMGLRAPGQGGCVTCGREHREWFEVEASRGGIRQVDAVVRRWVEWDERQG